jgi:hypothetical protein
MLTDRHIDNILDTEPLEAIQLELDEEEDAPIIDVSTCFPLHTGKA